MKIRRFGGLVLFLLAGNLTACSLPGFPNADRAGATLFARGIDEYLAGDELIALQQLADQDPQDPWQPRAAALLALIEELEQKQQQALQQIQQQELHGNLLLSGIEQQLIDCRQQRATDLEVRTQEMALCQREKTALSQDVKILEDTLTRLKDVLIQTERQAK